MEKQYYMYRHIRLDKNEPFYIGIGKKYGNKNFICQKGMYKRAYEINRRNEFWKKVINKTSYEVEILFESNDYDFIKKKEIEFISLYGRKDLKTGSLVNLTDGGEGTVNKIISEESKRKTTEAHCISVFNKKTKQHYNSIKDAAKSINIDKRSLSRQLKLQYPTCLFQYTDKNLIKPYINPTNIRLFFKTENKYYHSMNSFKKKTKLTEKQINDLLKKDNSDLIILSNNFKPIIKKDNRLNYTIHIPSKKIYSSIKEAWLNNDLKVTYDSFRSSVTKTLKFDYALCNEEGILKEKQLKKKIK